MMYFKELLDKYIPLKLPAIEYALIYWIIPGKI